MPTVIDVYTRRCPAIAHECVALCIASEGEKARSALVVEK
jgi:hypothetical protein